MIKDLYITERKNLNEKNQKKKNGISKVYMVAIVFDLGEKLDFEQYGFIENCDQLINKVAEYSIYAHLKTDEMVIKEIWGKKMVAKENDIKNI